MIKGRYTYGGRKLKRIANLLLYGVPASWSAYLVFIYVKADSGYGFFSQLAPQIRPYVLAVSVVLVVGFAWAGYRRLVSGPKMTCEKYKK